jgi:ribonucleoside-diphosphate reductase alpha chain
LDNIIDINKFPHKNFENYQLNMRTIGLGVTGLADMLTMLNLKYGSDESVKLVDSLMNFITVKTYLESIELAKELGSFNFLDRDKFVKSNFIKKHVNKYGGEWHDVIDGILNYGIRNARSISVAPTGTITLAYGNNCSSGIEPIFSLSYKRKVKIGGQSNDNIKIVDMKDHAYGMWQELKEGNVVDEDVFVTAMNLSVDDHVNILKTIAYHTDMSVSKTINIPTEYTFEDTKKVYDDCWKNGIKGCTIFRPNPIRQGILIDNATNKKQDISTNKNEHGDYSDLPWGATLEASDSLIGRKTKLMSGCGALHLQAWFDPDSGKLMEIFLSKGSSGGCNSFMGSLSRMTSLALRTGADFEYVIDQLKSAPACPSYVARTQIKKDCSKGNNCPSAISNALKKMQEDIFKELIVDVEEEVIEKVINEPADFSDSERKYLEQFGDIAFSKKYKKCPVCREELNNTDGCLTCISCGWSKCG